jgi:hypothetical protein
MFLGRFIALVHIRMVLLRQPPKRPIDVGLRRLTRQSKYGIRVSGHCADYKTKNG